MRRRRRAAVDDDDDEGCGGRDADDASDIDDAHKPIPSRRSADTPLSKPLKAYNIQRERQSRAAIKGKKPRRIADSESENGSVFALDDDGNDDDEKDSSECSVQEKDEEEPGKGRTSQSRKQKRAGQRGKGGTVSSDEDLQDDRKLGQSTSKQIEYESNDDDGCSDDNIKRSGGSKLQSSEGDSDAADFKTPAKPAARRITRSTSARKTSTAKRGRTSAAKRGWKGYVLVGEDDDQEEGEMIEKLPELKPDVFTTEHDDDDDNRKGLKWNDNNVEPIYDSDSAYHKRKRKAPRQRTYTRSFGAPKHLKATSFIYEQNSYRHENYDDDLYDLDGFIVSNDEEDEEEEEEALSSDDNKKKHGRSSHNSLSDDDDDFDLENAFKSDSHTEFANHHTKAASDNDDPDEAPVPRSSSRQTRRTVIISEDDEDEDADTVTPVRRRLKRKRDIVEEENEMARNDDDDELMKDPLDVLFENSSSIRPSKAAMMKEPVVASLKSKPKIEGNDLDDGHQTTSTNVGLTNTIIDLDEEFPEVNPLPPNTGIESSTPKSAHSKTPVKRSLADTLFNDDPKSKPSSSKNLADTLFGAEFETLPQTPKMKSTPTNETPTSRKSSRIQNVQHFKKVRVDQTKELLSTPTSQRVDVKALTETMDDEEEDEDGYVSDFSPAPRLFGSLREAKTKKISGDSDSDSDEASDYDQMGGFVVSDSEDVIAPSMFDCVCRKNGLVMAFKGHKLRCSRPECRRWVHGACFGLGPKDKLAGFQCHVCEPRKLKLAVERESIHVLTLQCLVSKPTDDQAFLTLFIKFEFSLAGATFPSQNGRTLLHILCGLNRPTLLERVYKANKDTVFATDLTGHTPLHVAAVHSIDCVRKLQELVPAKHHRKLLLAKDGRDMAPIMVALSQVESAATDNESSTGSTAIVSELAAWMSSTEGCDLGGLKISKTGENMVHMACRNAHYGALEVLKENCSDSKFTKMQYLSNGSGVPWRREDDDLEELCAFFPLEADDDGDEKGQDNEDVPDDEEEVLEDHNVEEMVEAEKRKTVEKDMLLEGVRALIDAGSTPFASDPHGSTPLHLAAAHGLTVVVKELLRRGVPADIQDHHAWTPLLYAHVSEEFEPDVSDDCILALLSAQPEQLLKLTTNMEDSQNLKVFRSLIRSLATKPQAYKFLNDFVRRSPESHYEVLPWLGETRGLLDLDNKKRLFLYRLGARRYSWGSTVRITARRNFELLSAAYALGSYIDLSNTSIIGSFENEIGGGPGVTRELWECLSTDMLRPEYGVFAQVNGPAIMAEPLSLEAETGQQVQSKVFFANDYAPCTLASSVFPQSLAQLIGKLCGVALKDNQLMPGVHNFSPLIFRLLAGEIPMGPMKLEYTDFEEWDEELFKSWSWMMQNTISEEFDFTFSVDEVVNGKVVSRPLPGHRVTDAVTDKNKEEYIKLMVQYKVDKIVRKAAAFVSGFFSVIPKTAVKVFSSNDLELLLGGVTEIDVSDWKAHTTYSYHSASILNDKIIGWFWSVVEEDMSETERALLLKFATSRSSVITGGFSCLSPSFQIALIGYVSRDQLREKLLLAIRHGSKGFQFC
ncbi:hypothetical protein HDV05_005421 [Chytridiales sp. JEL 0842]|nr:hypothetical protein HDV05_005421 [Chytridiales sp. JEL 0842]